MSQETRSCQNCKNTFTIEDEDFAYYEKVNVPAPTWCPECRLIRRMATSNLKNLYPDTCDLCGKKMLSMYSPDKPFKVYCNTCWWSDKWDATTYEREYDFNKTFFEQYYELQLQVPQMALSVNTPTVENSDFCNGAGYIKNCYWVFFADYSQDCFYSDYIVKMKDSFECLRSRDSELCFQCTNVTNSYGTFYSVDCDNCTNVMFSIDCIGCQDCFGCAGLRKKQFCIFNKQYSEKEYKEKIAELQPSSYKKLQELKEQAHQTWLSVPRKFMHGTRNQDVTGDYVSSSKNVKNGFFITEAEDCKYCAMAYLDVKDCFDYASWGDGVSLIYDSFGVGHRSTNVQFSYNAWESLSEIFYSTYCFSSSNLFGCAGLSKKQYYILNKQYSKEDYESMVQKIRTQMNEKPYKDSKGRTYTFGEFFPIEFNLHNYNESFAQEFFPKKKEEVEKLGWPWHDFASKNFQVTMQPEVLPDNVSDAPETITKEIIGCAHAGKCNDQCTTAFKIIPQELSFYKKHGMALPRLCPNCRLQERRAQLQPMKLWSRTCACKGTKAGTHNNTEKHFHGEDACPNTFETSYSPERKEIVYCEECYRSEMA